MLLFIQILIGILIGALCGMVSIGLAINKKENSLKLCWKHLTDALNTRYVRLKNLLILLKVHMTDFSAEIEQLILLCEEAVKTQISADKIAERLQIEDAINYKLEDVKSNMDKYPEMEQDAKLEAALYGIIEAETDVGDAIEIYNTQNQEYKEFIGRFPASLVARLMGKNPDTVPFSVTSAEELNENYIDEDEI